ncbi:MAG: 4-phosphoerythronate dehydrogenase [Verrucomicrobia bacterium]|nr:4-phosphoerythronate dehydrogenase [Verrucomicrobiota bacterium]
MPKIVCSSSVTYGKEAFSSLGEVHLVDGRTITREDLADAELLIIRSTTPVSAELVRDTAIRFVGTATIGVDHMDTSYFDRANIRWAHAPGCNAVSVADYITSAWLCLAAEHGLALDEQTLGVIGVGQVGRRVAQRGHALGMRLLLNDPPKEDAGISAEAASGIPGAHYVSRQALLGEASIVTLHVPLTLDGPYATHHMVDAAFCAHLQPGGVFINAARGPVAHTDALVAALDRGQIAHAVIDTWEGEPCVRRDLLARSTFASPHIAGYGFDGKVRGTEMVYRDACAFLGITPTWSPADLLPAPLVPVIEVANPPRERDRFLWEIVRQTYDIREDDARMRAQSVPDARARAAGFDAQRKAYPIRREFCHSVVRRSPVEAGWGEVVRALGFRYAPPRGD